MLDWISSLQLASNFAKLRKAPQVLLYSGALGAKSLVGLVSGIHSWFRVIAGGEYLPMTHISQGEKRLMLSITFTVLSIMSSDLGLIVSRCDFHS